MRIKQSVMEEIVTRIGQLGLTECPICKSGTIKIAAHPAIFWEGGSAKGAPDARQLFFARLPCLTCGYTMLFDLEQYYRDDEPILYDGRLDQERRQREAGEIDP